MILTKTVLLSLLNVSGLDAQLGSKHILLPVICFCPIAFSVVESPFQHYGLLE
jgi:hypothetical protein